MRITEIIEELYNQNADAGDIQNHISMAQEDEELTSAEDAAADEAVSYLGDLYYPLTADEYSEVCRLAWKAHKKAA